MTTQLNYFPDIGVAIDGKELNWKTNRVTVRQKLRGNYKPGDSVIDVSSSFNGSHDYDIPQRRDVYASYNDIDNLFYLNYDENDLLSEVEVHYGVEITLKDIILSFNEEIKNIVSKLQTLSVDNTVTENGEYFFKDLKMTIASSEAMGGEGDDMGYFYCFSSIDHLI